MENSIKQKYNLINVKRYLDTRYYVSSCGRIFTSKYKGTNCIKELKKCFDSDGYNIVTIYLESSKARTLKVHRMVSELFLKHDYSRNQINHKNGIKTDNRVENLEWCNGSENTKHAYRTGLRKTRKGEECNLSKLTEENVIDIRSKYIPRKYTIYKLAKEYNVTPQLISKILLKKCWNHI